MRWILRIAIGTALLWAGGLIAFRAMMPAPGSIPPAEAIAIFTGNATRVEEGLRLFREGYAPLLFISGVDTRLRVKDLGKMEEEKQSYITLDAASSNTIQNVKATKAWAEKNQLTHLIIVSDHYHIPRIRLLFQRFAPSLHLTWAPVLAIEFQDPHWWWFHPQAMLKLIREYHKFVVTFFLRFG